MPKPRPAHSPFLRHWRLDPAVAFLNHGSFGACPIPVLRRQQELRDRMEREPITFLDRELEGLLDDARAALAAFVGCDADGLAFVPNATAGVNTVVRSLALKPGDELLTADMEYNACNNVLAHAAAAAGAKVVIAQIPFPLSSEDEIVDAIIGRVTPRTRLALVSHVTSPTALVLPVRRLVRELSARGVDTIVDGAHAPGMLPLDIGAIGAAYYTGNCHKWLCAPKGAGFLHVRHDLQKKVRPLSISHGANSTRADRTRFRLEFDWTGTADPTAYLCVPAAIEFMGSLLPGGWKALMAHNRAQAVTAQKLLSAAVGIAPPCPDTLLGSMAAIPLPRRLSPSPLQVHSVDPLQNTLFQKHRLEPIVFAWPAPDKKVLRVSAQIYNTPAQYGALATALMGMRS